MDGLDPAVVLAGERVDRLQLVWVPDHQRSFGPVQQRKQVRDGALTRLVDHHQVEKPRCGREDPAHRTGGGGPGPDGAHQLPHALPTRGSRIQVAQTFLNDRSARGQCLGDASQQELPALVASFLPQGADRVGHFLGTGTRTQLLQQPDPLTFGGQETQDGGQFTVGPLQPEPPADAPPVPPSGPTTLQGRGAPVGPAVHLPDPLEGVRAQPRGQVIDLSAARVGHHRQTPFDPLHRGQCVLGLEESALPHEQSLVCGVDVHSVPLRRDQPVEDVAFVPPLLLVTGAHHQVGLGGEPVDLADDLVHGGVVGGGHQHGLPGRDRGGDHGGDELGLTGTRRPGGHRQGPAHRRCQDLLLSRVAQTGDHRQRRTLFPGGALGVCEHRERRVRDGVDLDPVVLAVVQIPDELFHGRPGGIPPVQHGRVLRTPACATPHVQVAVQFTRDQIVDAVQMQPGTDGARLVRQSGDTPPRPVHLEPVDQFLDVPLVEFGGREQQLPVEFRFADRDQETPVPLFDHLHVHDEQRGELGTPAPAPFRSGGVEEHRRVAVAQRPPLLGRFQGEILGALRQRPAVRRSAEQDLGPHVADHHVASVRVGKLLQHTLSQQTVALVVQEGAPTPTTVGTASLRRGLRPGRVVLLTCALRGESALLRPSRQVGGRGRTRVTCEDELPPHSQGEGRDALVVDVLHLAVDVLVELHGVDPAVAVGVRRRARESAYDRRGEGRRLRAMGVVALPGLLQRPRRGDDVGARPVAELPLEVDVLVLAGTRGEPIGEGTAIAAIQQKHLAPHPRILEHEFEDLGGDRGAQETFEPCIPEGEVQSATTVLHPVTGERDEQ